MNTQAMRTKHAGDLLKRTTAFILIMGTSLFLKKMDVLN